MGPLALCRQAITDHSQRGHHMGVKVVDFKGDGNAWIIVHDPRLPRRRLRKYVGRDWKAAELAASQIRVKLAANDFSFAGGARPPAGSTTLERSEEHTSELQSR